MSISEGDNPDGLRRRLGTLRRGGIAALTAFQASKDRGDYELLRPVLGQHIGELVEDPESETVAALLLIADALLVRLAAAGGQSPLEVLQDIAADPD